MISITVNQLLEDKIYDLKLKLVNSKPNLEKKILIPQIQKPGLALTGYTSNLHPGRVQILGSSEVDFLKKLPAKKLEAVVKKICQQDIACFIVTNNNDVPQILKKETNRCKIPLLLTSVSTPLFIVRVTRFLEDRLVESTTLHGVLIDIFGVGILLMGKSGIGKSECAMELIMKGHRLVADDSILIHKKPPSYLYGNASDLTKYHMEIRGLGIINIKDLFGVTSVRDQKMIELVVEMVEWDSKFEYERLGVDEQTYTILGINIPFIRLPVRAGRSLTSVIEVAARNHLLKLKGFYSARDFQARLTRQLLWSEQHLHEKKQ